MFNIWSLIQEASWDLCWNTFSGQPDHHRPHAAFTHTPVRSEEEAAANWRSQYTSLASQTYILIYLYVVKVDTLVDLWGNQLYIQTLSRVPRAICLEVCFLNNNRGLRTFISDN